MRAHRRSTRRPRERELWASRAVLERCYGTRMRWLRHGLFISGMVASVAALTSCGGSSNSSQNGSHLNIVAVSNCLRNEGFVLHGTSPGEAPSGMSATQVTASLKGCGFSHVNVSGPPEAGLVSAAKQSVVERELTKISACLQRRGFNVTPRANSFSVYPPFNANGVNTSSSGFIAADKACSRQFVEAVRNLGPSYIPGRDAEAAPGTLSPPATGSSHTATLAACVRKYGATVVQTGTLVGLKVPSKDASARIAAMLKKCDVGSAKIEPSGEQPPA
jgi:hypothetical protein